MEDRRKGRGCQGVTGIDQLEAETAFQRPREAQRPRDARKRVWLAWEIHEQRPENRLALVWEPVLGISQERCAAWVGSPYAMLARDWLPARPATDRGMFCSTSPSLRGATSSLCQVDALSCSSRAEYGERGACTRRNAWCPAPALLSSHQGPPARQRY